MQNGQIRLPVREDVRTEQTSRCFPGQRLQATSTGLSTTVDCLRTLLWQNSRPLKLMRVFERYGKKRCIYTPLSHRGQANTAPTTTTTTGREQEQAQVAAPARARLPAQSIYAKAEHAVESAMTGSTVGKDAMPAEVWARHVVKTLLENPRERRIWKGHNACGVWVAGRSMPAGFLDDNMRKMRRLNEVQRSLKGVS
ncbi:hypothetical protein EDD37DRAFT_360385 [Exophiala viscosa]|uniref:Uncharacterized protein n=1 Tax=Exophiala viscosa TaxID=2486360 RepID=A0AAN6DT74_9EURO|nr:hypothetical protein EDD36DRAFT_310708 [Exophiala viscosa]KAI1624762.1 hypothetical protein EDD37DRAFT_360385 [Exophiala viscosa]